PRVAQAAAPEASPQPGWSTAVPGGPTKKVVGVVRRIRLAVDAQGAPASIRLELTSNLTQLPTVKEPVAVAKVVVLPVLVPVVRPGGTPGPVPMIGRLAVKDVPPRTPLLLYWTWPLVPPGAVGMEEVGVGVIKA